MVITFIKSVVSHFYSEISWMKILLKCKAYQKANLNRSYFNRFITTFVEKSDMIRQYLFLALNVNDLPEILGQSFKNDN